MFSPGPPGYHVPMDFFEHQEVARRKTGLLVFYFVVAILLIIGTIYSICAVLVPPSHPPGADPGAYGPLLRWDLLGGVSVAVLLVIGLGSLFKIAQLAGGGARVALNLGGRPVDPDTRDFHEKRLLNLVEEMALASGLPVPPVYVMDRESAINAFAAGFSPDQAVIGVTRGFLTLLKRSEQQGVIAHEFSHILNGDMRLNIRLMGLVHGILVISLIGRGILYGVGRVRSRDGKGQLLGIVVGAALMLIGLAGVFFGKLIKSAVSRQREFLADASAAQFTRNPDGLASALKKIGGLAGGSRLAHPRAEEASHMFFGNGLRGGGFRLLATHPPLRERIFRLEPAWDGAFPDVRPVEPPPVPEARPGATQGLPFGQGLPPVLPLPGVRVPGLETATAVIAAGQVMESIGRPMQAHLEAASHILAGLPEALRDAAHDKDRAWAVVYLLLLGEDGDLRRRQLADLQRRAGDAALQRVQGLLPWTAAVKPEARIPLLDLALPALKQLTPEQYLRFKETVEDLVAADRQIDLFEYALRHTLLRNLDTHFGLAAKDPAQIYALRGVEDACSGLLSVLARFGHPDEARAASAFESAAVLLRQPGMNLRFMPADQCTLARADAALDRMRMLAPRLKREVIKACLGCISFDGDITVDEAELFRAVAGALACPVPPWMLTTAVERQEETTDGHG